MDFKSLRYVVAVAEHGSVSAAAKSLGISQPSLSKYLQNISSSFGVILFERGENGLVPTYAGERYLAAARQMLGLAKELDNIVPNAEQKPLCITCPPYEGSYIHPFAIRQFSEQYPDFNLMMLESSDTAALLRSGQADLAITSSLLPKDNFVSMPLIRDEILLVTAKNHWIANHALWKENFSCPWVDINLLRGEPIIRLFPNQRTRILADELMAGEHITPRVLMQTYSVLNAIRVASTGAGVCFAPALGMRHFRFTEPPAWFSVGSPLVMDIYCVYSKNNPPNHQATRFIELVADFLR